MPKATMEEENQWPLAEDTPYRAQLLEVVERTQKGGISKRTGKEYEGFTTWVWKFEVTEGEKTGQWCWADTDDLLTTLYGPKKVRTYAEALRGQVYELGEGIDTDDLIGMECYIEVANESYTKADGTDGFKCPVVAAYALAGSETVTDPWDSQAPREKASVGGGDQPLDPWATPEEPPF